MDARLRSALPQAEIRLSPRIVVATRWLPVSLFVAVVLAVAPWVEAPINDDWQYTRAAKLLADTGHLTIDTPIAPSIVVQSYLGSAIIGLFGFSHLGLRLLTVLFAALGLLCIQWILYEVRARRSWSVLALALVVINPIVLHVSLAFMSEWYGMLFALLAVALWFRTRARIADDDALPFWLYIATAALAVVAFWSRQFAVVFYPALVFSRVPVWWRKRLGGSRGEILGSVTGALVVLAGVLGYFAWARATGNYKPEFAKPVSSLTHFSGELWLIQTAVCLAYMTAAFLPILLLARLDLARRVCVVVGGSCAALMIGGLLGLQDVGHRDFCPRHWLNARFPYLGNVIYDAGVGPITLDEVYRVIGGPHPSWSHNVWLYIEFVILLSTVLWGGLAGYGQRQPREIAALSGTRRELNWFAGAWLVGALALTIQAYQGEVFDRYHFPCIIALALLIPARLTDAQRQQDLTLGVRPVLAATALLLLAWFSIAGTHDYMLWNHTRAELYNRARELGASTANIQAGYELDGWYNFKADPPAHCIGKCRCDSGTWWPCWDSSYRVVMGDIPRLNHALSTANPAYWLAGGPALSLIERDPP